jgi:hypothetical protein
MNEYKVVCPSCNSEFENYEKYIGQPSLRMRARIVKKGSNEE